MPPTPPPQSAQQEQQALLQPSTHPLPRFVLYAQTHHKPGPAPQEPISLLPLITNNTGVTHVIVAAIHLNEGPGNITLNDDPPDSPKFDTLWAEVAWLQGAGVKVMGMLGGAAKGSYWRLQGSDEEARLPALLSTQPTSQTNNPLSSSATTSPSATPSAATTSTASTSTSKKPSRSPRSSASSRASAPTSARPSSPPSPPSPPPSSRTCAGRPRRTSRPTRAPAPPPRRP